MAATRATNWRRDRDRIKRSKAAKLSGKLGPPLFLGFFSCGYQLGFITAHFPAFVTELCGPISPGGVLAGMGITTTSALGAFAIAVIGMANIGGTLAAGALGRHFPRKYLLSGIYAGRTLVAAWFILTPVTPASVLIFSALMGSLWLATVPLTSGLVAHIWGVRYMGSKRPG